MRKSVNSSKRRKIRRDVLDKYGRICYLCRDPIVFTSDHGVVSYDHSFVVTNSGRFKKGSLDHIHRLIDGGKDTKDNLRPCCVECNWGREVLQGLKLHLKSVPREFFCLPLSSFLKKAGSITLSEKESRVYDKAIRNYRRFHDHVQVPREAGPTQPNSEVADRTC